MHHFVNPHFCTPHSLIVDLLLIFAHLRFSICFASRGAKEEKRQQQHRKIRFVVFATTFIHLHKKEIRLCLFARQPLAERERESKRRFEITLSFANLPPNQNWLGSFISLPSAERCISIATLNSITCIDVKMGQVNISICLLVHHFAHYTSFFLSLSTTFYAISNFK